MRDGNCRIIFDESDRQANLGAECMKANVLIMIGVAIMLVGAICFAYRLYEIVQIDARSRGFKHPKTWGLCSISSNNGSGLLLYLIKRRKYPIIELSKEDMERIEKSKKAISAAIIFVATGAILIVVSIILK